MNRSSLRALLLRFGANQRGVSAIEFGLLLPFLMLLLAGTVDLSEGLTVSRKLRQISSTVSDLIAQRSSATSSEVTTILAGAATMLEPYDTTNLKIMLTVLTVTGTTQKVAWSSAFQQTAETAGATPAKAVPANIAESGVQLVTVTVSYTFTTVFSSFLSGITNTNGYAMTDFMFERPRIGDSVALN